MTQLLTAPPEQIRRYARQALQAADIADKTPVPLDLVERAAGLHPHEDLYVPDVDLPPEIARIMSKMKASAKILGGLAIPEKRVYLDSSLVLPRQRFAHGHELGHHVLPWQQQAYYADDDRTLAPNTRDAMEAEANMFASELLFGIDRFTTMADDHKPSITVPLQLNQSFAVSAHAALRRYISTSRHPLALLALGRFKVNTTQGPGLRPFPNHCVESAAFADHYGPVNVLVATALALSDHPALEAIATAGPASVIEDGGDITLDTKRGRIAFKTQAFTNGRLNFVVIFGQRIGRLSLVA